LGRAQSKLGRSPERHFKKNLFKGCKEDQDGMDEPPRGSKGNRPDTWFNGETGYICKLPDSASAQRKQDGRPTLLPCPAGTCGLSGEKTAVELQHCSAKNCPPVSAPAKAK
jgi:hypothetical protein